MYQMTTRLEIPITTLADGTALLTICPLYSLTDAIFVTNGTFLPFASVAVGSTTTPYVASPAAYSPFATQRANIMTFAVDSVQVDFINTQSTINVQGKLTTSIFYEPPNVTYFRGNAGTYVTAAISITDQ
jgi:hypothetical protein